MGDVVTLTLPPESGPKSVGTFIVFNDNCSKVLKVIRFLSFVNYDVMKI